jgi:lysozyme
VSRPTTTSAKGIELITSFEGLELTSYKDAVGIWTIGYGHTGPEVKYGQKITKEEATDLLKKDLEWVENTIRSLVKTPITQSQFDALASFIFNVGGTRFSKSTLLLALNAGEYQKAADEFLKWDKAGGNVLPGLTRRRKAERELFLKGEQV